eukprot:TRINITY_DN19310_c0_g1_i1.p1 TRINITY_DN19310_c0_g1~~TRINITY_DN19310_c0_g1_i1.p1  ORF type:complete len:448 (+),score=49.39 TRINITY_DN19310_c0_g1_i1:41-1384(+)
MFIVLLLATFSSLRGEWYGESVDVRLLSDGRAHVVASMEMKTNFNVEGGYSELFPEDFRRLASTLELKSMKLSFVRGAWRDCWGRQQVPAPPATSITAEIPESNWGPLVTQVGGMSSCSLHHLGDTHEIPHVIASVIKLNGTIRGYLPSEQTFCTENFSPILDLTPYKGSGGVASLLSPMLFFKARYHAIHVIFSSTPKPSLKVVAEFVDEPGISGSYKVVIPATCTLCTEKVITAAVHVPPDVEKLEQVTDEKAVHGWESTYGADMEQSAYFRLELQSPTLKMRSNQHGDGSGTLMWEVSNLPKDANELTLNLILPSRLISAHISRMVLPPIFSYKVFKLTTDVLIQINCSSHPENGFQVSLPFDKHILPLDGYPPDANCLYLLPPSFLSIGFDVESFVVYPPMPAVITLPVPDFSMPFHIITLSCTALALLLGSVFAHVTKGFVP